eukprot:Rmarinus@m.28677
MVADEDWLVDNGIAEPWDRRSSRDLHISESLFEAGYEYSLQVTATYANEPSVAGTSLVSVIVLGSDVEVSLDGPSNLAAGAFVLEAQACDPDPDPECVANNTADFMIRWDCVREPLSGSGDTEDCSTSVPFLNALADNSPILEIGENDLEPSEDWQYHFTVIASHSDGVRSASAERTLLILPVTSDSRVLDVRIAYEGAADPFDPEIVSPAIRHKFLGSVANAETLELFEYEWTCTEGDLNRPEDPSIIDPTLLTTSAYVPLLGLAADVLTPGLSYTLQLSVSATTSQSSGYATVSFTVALPPAGGVILAQQGTVTARTDSEIVSMDALESILLRALSWESPYDEDELTYLFGHYPHVDEEEEKTRSTLLETSVNSASVLVPVNSDVNATLVNLYVQVHSKYGAYAVASLVVDLWFDHLSEDELQSAIGDNLDDAMSTGDTAATLTAVSSGSALLGTSDGDGREGIRAQMMQSVSWAQSSIPFPTESSVSQVANAVSGVTSQPDELTDDVVSESLAVIESMLSEGVPLTEESTRSTLEAISNIFVHATTSQGPSVHTFVSRHEVIEESLYSLARAILAFSDCGEVSSLSAASHISLGVALLSPSSVSHNFTLPGSQLSVEFHPGSSSDCYEVLVASFLSEGSADTSFVAEYSVTSLTSVSDESLNATFVVPIQGDLVTPTTVSPALTTSSSPQPTLLSTPQASPVTSASSTAVCQVLVDGIWLSNAEYCTVGTVTAEEATFFTTGKSGFHHVGAVPVCPVDDNGARCSGKGECEEPNVCTCFEEDQWTGRVCDEPVCGVCSKHGSC